MNFLQRFFKARAHRQDEVWQGPIAEQVSVLLIRLLPPHWNSALLILEAPEEGGGGGGGGAAHAVASPEAHRDAVVPDADLLRATRQFEIGCKERGWLWKKAYFKVDRAGENWNFDLSYLYD